MECHISLSAQYHEALTKLHRCNSTIKRSQTPPLLLPDHEALTKLHHCMYVLYHEALTNSSVLCKPVGAKLWPISENRENCNSLSDFYLHISKYHRRPNKRFYGACRTYANLMPILRRFRIIRCNRQAALHSALSNYTPLLTGGEWQK
jgi:hypothetical protein